MTSKTNSTVIAPGAKLRYGTWLGYLDELALPLTPDNYRIEQVGEDRWAVTDLAGTEVYRGIGPVEVLPAS